MSSAGDQLKAKLTPTLMFGEVNIATLVLDGSARYPVAPRKTQWCRLPSPLPPRHTPALTPRVAAGVVKSITTSNLSITAAGSLPTTTSRLPAAANSPASCPSAGLFACSNAAPKVRSSAASIACTQCAAHSSCCTGNGDSDHVSPGEQ